MAAGAGTAGAPERDHGRIAVDSGAGSAPEPALLPVPSPIVEIATLGEVPVRAAPGLRVAGLPATTAEHDRG